MNTISNLQSPRSGAPVANQFVITSETSNGTRVTFQSYQTRIAYYENGHLFLDSNALYYSRTTSKYLYQFTGMNREQLQEQIDIGVIEFFN